MAYKLTYETVHPVYNLTALLNSIALAHNGIADTNQNQGEGGDVEAEQSVSKTQRIHRNKKTQTWNRWTRELEKGLVEMADNGMSIDEMMERARRRGLPYTRDAVVSRLYVLGYRISGGVPYRNGGEK
jgi:hypothetical protein